MTNRPAAPVFTAAPEPFTQAKWIWADQYYWDLHNGYALFRKTVELAAVPKKAPFFITADQLYHLYVNGRFVCRECLAQGCSTNFKTDRSGCCLQLGQVQGDLAGQGRC